MSHQPQTETQRQTQYVLNRLPLSLARHARRATRCQEKYQEAAASLHSLEQAHPDFNRSNIRESIGYVFLIAFLVAVYLFDYILFGPTAEYFARHSFPNSSLIIVIARLVIPAGFLMIEIAIAIQLYFSHRASDEYGNSRVYVLWVILGLLFALVMPTQVLATLLASQPVIMSSQLRVIFNAQLIGLISLTMVAHVAILFGGSPTHEAKAFLAFKLRQLFLRWRKNYWKQHAELEADDAADDFSRYSRLLSSYNVTSQPRFEIGPFDMVTQKLLQARFGHLAWTPLANTDVSPLEQATAITRYGESELQQSTADHDSTLPGHSSNSSDKQVVSDGSLRAKGTWSADSGGHI